MASKIPPVGELRKICQTPESSLHDTWYGSHVVRAVSIYLTRLFIHTPITANQVTVLMLIVGVIAGTLFIFGKYWYSIIGAMLLQLAYVLDATDGEVARYKGISSLRGEYLDRLCHNVASPYIFVGISFGVYANFHDVRLFIFGFSASLFFPLLRLIALEKSKILRKVRNDVREDGIISTFARQTKWRGIVSSLSKRMGGKVIDPAGQDIMLIAILVGAALDRIHIVLIIYGILLPCRWLLQAVFDLKYGFNG